MDLRADSEIARIEKNLGVEFLERLKGARFHLTVTTHSFG